MRVKVSITNMEGDLLDQLVIEDSTFDSEAKLSAEVTAAIEDVFETVDQ